MTQCPMTQIATCLERLVIGHLPLVIGFLLGYCAPTPSVARLYPRPRFDISLQNTTRGGTEPAAVFAAFTTTSTRLAGPSSSKYPTIWARYTLPRAVTNGTIRFISSKRHNPLAQDPMLVAMGGFVAGVLDLALGDDLLDHFFGHTRNASEDRFRSRVDVDPAGDGGRLIDGDIVKELRQDHPQRDGVVGKGRLDNRALLFVVLAALIVLVLAARTTLRRIASRPPPPESVRPPGPPLP